jgi:putative transposase
VEGARLGPTFPLLRFRRHEARGLPHCLVPGGGIAPDGKSWIACRPGFFLPVRVLSRMFRGLLLQYLEKAFAAGELNFFSQHRHLHEPAAFRRYLAPAYGPEWVVYAKRPFAGPAQVLEYVGRYTHRVAISNNRLVSMDDARSGFVGRTTGIATARRR